MRLGRNKKIRATQKSMPRGKSRRNQVKRRTIHLVSSKTLGIPLRPDERTDKLPRFPDPEIQQPDGARAALFWKIFRYKLCAILQKRSTLRVYSFEKALNSSTCCK